MDLKHHAPPRDLGKGGHPPGVQMPREDHVGTAVGQFVDGPLGAAHQFLRILGRVLHRVMHDHHAHPPLLGGEAPPDPRERARAEPSLLPGQRIDRVGAHHDHLVILPAGLQIAAEPAAIALPGLHEADVEIVERHVVIAGHHQHRWLQRGHEGRGRPELRLGRALGEIARDRHQIRLEPVHRLDQRPEKLGPVPAEMQVGKVQQSLHRTSRSQCSGTVTSMAPSMALRSNGGTMRSRSPSRATCQIRRRPCGRSIST